MTRSIASATRQASREIKDLVQSALVTELLSPSKRIWLVSAWITDATVIDNRGGEFSTLFPAWTEREIRLSEALAALLTLGASVTVVTNTHEANEPFARALREAARSIASERQLHMPAPEALSTSAEDGLHRKRLVTERFVIWGSMNFTRSGIERNAEDISIETDRPTVARAINEMEMLYGGLR